MVSVRMETVHAISIPKQSGLESAQAEDCLEVPITLNLETKYEQRHTRQLLGLFDGW
jgi:hypothetical protein